MYGRSDFLSVPVFISKICIRKLVAVAIKKPFFIIKHYSFFKKQKINFFNYLRNLPLVTSAKSLLVIFNIDIVKPIVNFVLLLLKTFLLQIMEQVVNDHRRRVQTNWKKVERGDSNRNK